MRALILLIFLSSCSYPYYTGNVQYDDEKDVYTISVAADFSKCRKIGLTAHSHEKKIYEHWQKDGGRKMTVSVPAAELSFDTADVYVFCDGRQFKNSIRIHHSTFPLINALNTRSGNLPELAEKYKRHIQMPSFYNEFKNFVMQSNKNFEFGKPVFNHLPVKYRVDVLLSGLKEFPDAAVKETALLHAPAVLEEPSAEELLEMLLKDRDVHYRVHALEIIFSRPVKRFFTRFFPIVYTDKTILAAYMGYLAKAPDTEFAGETFRFMKEKLELGDRNPFLDAIFDVYKTTGSDRVDFAQKLLFSQNADRSTLALKLLAETDIDKTIAGNIRMNWKKLDDSAKSTLYPKVMKFFDRDAEFYQMILDDPYRGLDGEILHDMLLLETKYSDPKIIQFYNAAVKAQTVSTYAIDQYFDNAPASLQEKGYAQYIESHPGDIEFLERLQKYFPQWYERALVAAAQNKQISKEAVLRSFEKLAGFGEKYLGLIIGAFEQETDPGQRLKILQRIIGYGDSGQAFVVRNISAMGKDEQTELLSELAINGNVSSLIFIMDNLKTLNAKDLAVVLQGLANGRKNIDCGVIENIFFEHQDYKVKRQAIWTMVYCCKDHYLDFVKKFDRSITAELYKEAVNGFKDYFELYDRSDRGAVFTVIQSLYGKWEKSVRPVDAILELIEEYGVGKGMELFKVIARETGDKGIQERQKRYEARFKK